MKLIVRDGKTPLSYFIFSRVNNFVVRKHFREMKIEGMNHLPDGPFILVSNHTSRWDGLILYHMLQRPANFLVSPNEMRGLQGLVLRSMGAFPASGAYDLHGHVYQQLGKGEPVVIFPEGDIYDDGTTHQFKSGAARFALACARAGLKLPVIAAAIRHDKENHKVSVALAEAVDASKYLVEGSEGFSACARILTERLAREVCHLRYQLGSRSEQSGLFSPSASRSWVHPTPV